MDVDEYLRQKRELERKKDILEAKEKLKEVKDEGKKHVVREALRESAPRHEAPANATQGEPALKPWMIWDMLILIIVISTFIVSYYFPRYNEASIKEIIKSDPSLITGNAVLQTSQQQEATQNNQQTTTELEQTQLTVREEPKKSLPGPDFSLTLSDKDEGEFGADGKIQGRILDIRGQNIRHYGDLTLEVTNNEESRIRCDITRDIQVDTNFDGVYTDAKNFGTLAKLEIDPSGKESVKDVIPGTVKVGTFNGRGGVIAEYTSTCYFCKDEGCNSWEQDGPSEETKKVQVLINKNIATNSTG